MREELIEQVGLICPRCRHGGADDTLQSPLKFDRVFTKEGNFVLEGFLVCSNAECRSRYPILEGVPVVLKDIEGWWHSQKSKLSHIACEPTEIQEYFADLNKNESFSLAERGLLSSYMDLHYGGPSDTTSDLASWTDSEKFWDTVVEMARHETKGRYERSLDLGCSVGRYTFELARLSDLTIGLDLNFKAVSSAARFHRTRKISYERRKHGRYFENVEPSYSPPDNVLFLVADALDPPFSAESFDLVVGLNLVDNVKVPLVLIGQMDALLRPGGSLILGSPYEWRADISEPGEWLETDELESPDMVLRILEGKMLPEMGLKYDVCKEFFNVPWALRHHTRYWSFFLVHLIKARKIADTF